MGMGNDGMELPNSLGNYSGHLNNSRVRDVNSEKSGGRDDIPKENAMGNIVGWHRIDSSLSGESKKCQNNRNGSEVMNNSFLESSNEDDRSLQQSSTFTYSREEKLEEKDFKNGSPSDDTDYQTRKGDSGPEIDSQNNLYYHTRKGDIDSEVSKSILSVGVQEMGVKSNIDSPQDLECQTGTTPVPPVYYRNESLLRVSYLKRDWGGKRVSDIRSVSELIDTFYSLEEPIIMPLPRQRDYYNQWARIPRCDVIQRLYPRSNNNNMSAKYWNLFQAIQNEQGKSNAMQSPGPSPKKLAPPSNSEVTCKSLDSIIDHYNQMLQHQHTEEVSAAGANSIPLAQRIATSKNRTNSGSSRSSSSSSNRSNLNSSNIQKQNGGNKSVTRLKVSPLPFRKVKGEGPIFDSNPSLKELDVSSLGTSSYRIKKKSFPDYDCVPSNVTDAVLSSVEVFDIADAQLLCQAPRSPASSRKMSDLIDCPQDSNETKPTRETNGLSGQIVPMSSQDNQDTNSSPQPDYNEQERTSVGQSCRDASRNLYGVNTNTLSLSLPYEKSQTVAEMPSPSIDGNNCNKSKVASPYEDLNARGAKAPEKHERFPLRNTAFISRSKRATTAIDIGYSKTKLKNLTRAILPTPHNIQNLRESLLIHEIGCDTDNTTNSDQQKWEHIPKRRICSSNKVPQSLQHDCSPMLPVRTHSMLEHHLNTRMSPEEKFSHEAQRTPTRGNSTVSLASVHFLDLADLKKLLKKSNTTITHL